MSRRKPDIEYVKGYSIALLCLGFFLLLGALQFRFPLHGTESDPSFAFISSILCLIGLSCLAVALLRWLRVAAALPATVALSVCLLLAIPFGTLLSLYWLKNVRPKELAPRDRPRHSWFNYAVALYILGLLMLDMTLTLRFVQSLPGSEVHLLTIVEWGGLILALAAIATGTVLSTRAKSWS